MRQTVFTVVKHLLKLGSKLRCSPSQSCNLFLDLNVLSSTHGHLRMTSNKQRRNSKKVCIIFTLQVPVAFVFLFLRGLE